MVKSNVVTKKNLRRVQKETLEFMSECLVQSFGPVGSNTCINIENAFNNYTKDGHTILGRLFFTGVIEHAVKEDIEAITRNIIKEVGDGTTSAILLSSIIFNGLCELEENNRLPNEIIKDFKKAVKEVSENIISAGRDCTIEDVYNIAYTSTNGDEEIAKSIMDIYEEFGTNVFIDVTTSSGKETILKTYDGMTLESPYADAAFINNKKEGVSIIRHANIYAFEDPIDTPEMFAFFDTIINNNIIIPLNGGTQPVPTVIMCPKLSRDVVSLMDSTVDFMFKFDASGQSDRKPPLNIITNIYEKDIYLDITRLCGCKTIKKYIDPIMQFNDIEKGLAPTPETVCDFAGSADVVQSDVNRTKFVNPARMHEATGENSPMFNSMVDVLEAELNKAISEGENANVVGNLKRRINSLKANMVEYHVGGITVADRDSKMALVEDAVLNCRAASRHGVGYGANFEGLIASMSTLNKLTSEDSHAYMVDIIYNAYRELSKMLYQTSGVSNVEAEEILEKSLQECEPYNLRTKEHDGLVLTSINADTVILDGIAKIVTIMFTCNQFLCPTPLHNIYFSAEDLSDN